MNETYMIYIPKNVLLQSPPGILIILLGDSCGETIRILWQDPTQYFLTMLQIFIKLYLADDKHVTLFTAFALQNKRDKKKMTSSCKRYKKWRAFQFFFLFLWNIEATILKLKIISVKKNFNLFPLELFLALSECKMSFFLFKKKKKWGHLFVEKKF